MRKLTVVVLALATLAGCSSAIRAVTPHGGQELERALASGDASLVHDDQILLDAALDEIALGRTRFAPIFDALFDPGIEGRAGLPDVNWRPTLQSAWLEPRFPHNISVIEAELLPWERGLPAQGLAIAGETATSRYVVFNADPFREFELLNDDTRRFLENTIRWLAYGKQEEVDIVFAGTGISVHFQSDRSRNCRAVTLVDCIGDADLLVVSPVAGEDSAAEEFAAAVDAVMQRGVSIMYVHQGADVTPVGSALLERLHVTYRRPNMWYEPKVRPHTPGVGRDPVPTHIADIETVYRYFRDGGIELDLADCDGQVCPADSWYTTTFRPAVRSIRFILESYDQSRQSIFERQGHRLEKLSVLLADFWRSRVVFPMDARSTDAATFLKSLYADHVVHVYRLHNPAQADMGNYSRADFKHVMPTSATVTLTPKRDYRSAGVYALPGQTVAITRVDDRSAVGTRIRINSLRDGTTRFFDPRAYNRPAFAGASPMIAIAPGETVRITSPYGGPIHVYFDEAGHDVSFRFDNVGLHPYWNGPEDSARFLESLKAGDYDWAEFANPYFEITSRTGMLRETMAHELIEGSPERLDELITRYHHDIPRALAGYRGDAIDVPESLQLFATRHGLSLATWDKVQHLNADQSLCGSACAGNPYDSGWAFQPLGHGHLHELGHGLESKRTRFSTWPTHASTNWYVYYTKYRFHEETGLDTGCGALPYRALFDLVQESRRQADPGAFVAAADDGDLSRGATIMLQMLAAAQFSGGLEDGWMLLSRIQLIVREFDKTLRDPVRWRALREGLGFGGMSLDRAGSLSSEDWLLIAASHASGVDFTQFLQMWGASIDPGIQQIIAERDYIDWSPTFYAMRPVQHCYTGLGEAIPVPADGQSAWPFRDSAASPLYRIR